MRSQKLISELKVDVLFLFTEPEVCYFSGYHSQFWESQTCPWFLLPPLKGRPIVIIPKTEHSDMQTTWIEDIRSWSAPDLRGDGLNLLI